MLRDILDWILFMNQPFSACEWILVSALLNKEWPSLVDFWFILKIKSRLGVDYPIFLFQVSSMSFKGFKGFYSICHAVVVITTSQLHSAKPEFRYCTGSNPACSVSEIRHGEDLWQWSWLEIRLNAFRWSTIPRKQFIIYHHSVTRLLRPPCLFLEI